MKKKYYAQGKIYTFDIDLSIETYCDAVMEGICRENGKTAWLDANGIQFIGEHRFEAKELAETTMPFGCKMWGGQIRDALPHGTRYYLRR